VVMVAEEVVIGVVMEVVVVVIVVVMVVVVVVIVVGMEVVEAIVVVMVAEEVMVVDEVVDTEVVIVTDRVAMVHLPLVGMIAVATEVLQHPHQPMVLPQPPPPTTLMEVPQLHQLLLHTLHMVLPHLHNNPVTTLVPNKATLRVTHNRVMVNKVIAVRHSNQQQLRQPVILKDMLNKEHLRRTTADHMVVTNSTQWTMF